MSDKNKHFKFELDRKLNPWVKFEPNFLTRVTKRKIENTTVYPLFSLFIQFSPIEIRFIFSHAKLLISWLQRIKKRCARWWARDIFQHTELTIKANPPCFSMHVCTSARQWRHKLCAVRMRGAKQGNDLNIHDITSQSSTIIWDLVVFIFRRRFNLLPSP